VGELDHIILVRAYHAFGGEVEASNTKLGWEEDKKNAELNFRAF
jgi:hypothetical protein